VNRAAFCRKICRFDGENAMQWNSILKLPGIFADISPVPHYASAQLRAA